MTGGKIGEAKKNVSTQDSRKQWRYYEREKARIRNMGLSCREYEAEILRLVRKLGV